jgi:predicted ATP-grasp superfamily ATP-dependent carboligase
MLGRLSMGVGMTTVLVRHQVADYDVWKREYDRIISGPLGAAVLTHQVWRGQDDPNLVVVAETYASRTDADAAAAHPDLLAAFSQAGVVMASVQVDFLADVESGPP